MGIVRFLAFQLLEIAVGASEIVWDSEVCQDFDKSTCPKVQRDVTGDFRKPPSEWTPEERCPPPRKLYQRFDPEHPCCPKVNISTEIGL